MTPRRFLILLAYLIGAAMIVGTGDHALGHEFFSSWCCSGKDCRPLQEGDTYKLLEDGSANVRHDGAWYHLPRTQEVHANHEVRRVMPSEDARPYLCVHPPELEPCCLYYSVGGW